MLILCLLILKKFSAKIQSKNDFCHSSSRLTTFIFGAYVFSDMSAPSYPDSHCLKMKRESLMMFEQTDKHSFCIGSI